MPRERLSRRTTQLISEINMTPMIDLTFLLLITFVITFPLVQYGIPVNLPQGKTSDLPAEKTHSVSVDGKGQLYVDDRRCSEEQFEAAIREWSGREPAATILVRADEGVPYGRVVRVMKSLHGAKLTKLALVTRAEEAKPR